MPVSRRIRGTFHFHSTYSHDGCSTLSEIVSTLRGQGFSFCVMTEHFEDFDACTFGRYLDDVAALNEQGGFVLVPGVEVDLLGLHTIVFPAVDFAEITRLASGERAPAPPMFTVLAHPSKYPLDRLLHHLQRYRIDGIELWNQQADGRYLPPLAFLDSFRAEAAGRSYRYFFGCDLHDVKLTVANVLSIPRPASLTAAAIARELIEGECVASNLATRVEFRNGTSPTDFPSWLDQLHRQSNYRGRALRVVRRGLRRAYHWLPRDTQRSLNDFKNFVRNKV
jgi:hypothetical protein